MTNFTRSLIALTLGILLGAAGLSLAAVDTSFQAASGGGPRNPGFTFQGDTETGMFQQGPGRLEFSVSGTRVLVFGAGGETRFGGNVKIDGTLFVNSIQGFSPLTIRAPSATHTALVVKSWDVAGSGTIMEWQTSAGDVLTTMDGAGNVTSTVDNWTLTGQIDLGLVRTNSLTAPSGTLSLGADVLLNGELTFSAAPRTIQIAAADPSFAGKDLNITAGAATGPGDFDGGALTLSGGAGTGAGATGIVTINGATTFGSNISLNRADDTFSSRAEWRTGGTLNWSIGQTAGDSFFRLYEDTTERIRLNTGTGYLFLDGRIFAQDGNGDVPAYTFASSTGAMGMYKEGELLKWSIEGGERLALDLFGLFVTGDITIRETVALGPNNFSRFTEVTGVTTLLKTELPASTPLISAEGAAGNITAGTYLYKVTFVTASGETHLVDNSESVALLLATPPSIIELTAIPTGSPGIVTGRNVYRSNDAGATYKRITAGTTLADNTTTIFSDNTDDISANAAGPSVNTTLDARLTITNPGDTTIVGTLTVSPLTADSFLYSGTAGLLSTTAAPTDGQLLIGSTGAAPVVATPLGTADQITVTPGAGSLTWSLPAAIVAPGSLTTTTTLASGTTLAAGTSFSVATTSLFTGVATHTVAPVFTPAGVPAAGAGKVVLCYDAATGAISQSATALDCS